MTEKRKNRLISIAHSLSDLRTGKNLHFSFILDKNKLLVSASNSYDKNHPKHLFGEYKAYKTNNGKYVPGVHSEIAAIKQFMSRFGHSDFSGLTLFNVRISKAGNILLAKPCNNCDTVIRSFNFKKVLWT